MAIVANCNPRYLCSINAVGKYFNIALAIIVTIFASTKLCFQNYMHSDQHYCQSVFDANSDVHGQAFVVVAAALMAGTTAWVLLIELMNVRHIDCEANFRTTELFFNGIGFAVFAFMGALETWYATGYYAGADYISPLNVQTAWIVAAACSFANALLHLLTMIIAGLSKRKD